MPNPDHIDPVAIDRIFADRRLRAAVLTPARDTMRAMAAADNEDNWTNVPRLCTHAAARIAAYDRRNNLQLLGAPWTPERTAALARAMVGRLDGPAAPDPEEIHDPAALVSPARRADAETMAGNKMSIRSEPHVSALFRLVWRPSNPASTSGSVADHHVVLARSDDPDRLVEYAMRTVDRMRAGLPPAVMSVSCDLVDSFRKSIDSAVAASDVLAIGCIPDSAISETLNFDAGRVLVVTPTDEDFERLRRNWFSEDRVIPIRSFASDFMNRIGVDIDYDTVLLRPSTDGTKLVLDQIRAALGMVRASGTLKLIPPETVDADYLRALERLDELPGAHRIERPGNDHAAGPEPTP